MPRHGVADVILRSRAMLALDEAGTIARTGRFVLTDGHNIVAGGLIDMKGYPDQRESMTVRSSNLQRVAHARDGLRRASSATAIAAACSGSPASRAPANRPSPWRWRAASSRRATWSMCWTATTSASGLNANLSFSPEDRAENIRRIGEVAAALRRCRA